MPDHDFEAGRVIVTLNRDYFCHDDIDCLDDVLIGIDYEKVVNIFRSKPNANQSGDVLLVHLKCGKKESVIDAIETFMENPNVMFAEPDFFLDSRIIPNDPYYSYLWGLDRIKAPSAWDYTTGCGDVIVGVVDSGVDFTHPDIRDNIWVCPEGMYGACFCGEDCDPMDTSGHGTHVAGTIGAVGNNHIGITGTAWNVKIASLKIGQRDFSLAAAIAAIDYANSNQIPILNNSWGGRLYSPSLKHAIEQYGGLFVASAGNYGVNNDFYPDFPASYDCENIIAVAATNVYDELADFSNFGERSVDIAAPGTDIYSLSLHGEYSYMCGTSMSAPFVAGAAALLKSYMPQLTALEIKEIILSSVDKRPSLTGFVSSGGVLNITAMLEYAERRANPA
jgi:subtilisin family serine protease